MILATTNDKYESTPTLTTGSTSDDISNITDSNFALNCTISPPGFQIVISFGSITASYIALHGLFFSDAQRGTTVSASVRDNGSNIKTFNTNSGFSDIFMYFDERSFSNLQIAFTGDFGDLTISYAAAGLSTVVPHGGLNPGQVLPYLQYNFKTKGQLNTNGQPIQQRRRKVPTSVNVNLPKVLASWVREDLKRVFDLYAQTGVVSMLDFESENYPTESWAGFNLKQTKATAFSGTRQLIPVSLSFSASPDYGVYYL